MTTIKRPERSKASIWPRNLRGKNAQFAKVYGNYYAFLTQPFFFVCCEWRHYWVSMNEEPIVRGDPKSHEEKDEEKGGKPIILFNACKKEVWSVGGWRKNYFEDVSPAWSVSSFLSALFSDVHCSPRLQAAKSEAQINVQSWLVCPTALFTPFKALSRNQFWGGVRPASYVGVLHVSASDLKMDWLIPAWRSCLPVLRGGGRVRHLSVIPQRTPFRFSYDAPLAVRLPLTLARTLHTKAADKQGERRQQVFLNTEREGDLPKLR